MDIVVLDTNVIVSAIYNPHGKYGEVVSMALHEEIELRYSREILEEYADVLARPEHGLSVQEQDLYLRSIIEVGTLVSSIKSDVSIRDESDRKFYDIATTCKAILITGDKDLLSLNDKCVMSVGDYLSEWQRLKKLEFQSRFRELP